MFMKKNIFFIFLMISLSAFAQQPNEGGTSEVPVKSRKRGNFYFTWGYNRSCYNKSDIHFMGPGYDFILHDVIARDRPTPLSLQYIDPAWLSIPQFNFRIGYFLNDKYCVSIGWDHMKYVVDVPQRVTITGQIGSTVSDPPISTNIPSANYMGVYNGNSLEIQPDFLLFEHTDGLNLATVDIERYDQLWKSRKHSNLGLSVVTGVGLGPMIPRSDVHLFGVGDNHPWNLSGWGCLAKAGLNFDILRWLFFRTDLKTGYISLSQIPTTGRDVDVAKQKIVFYENSWLLGFRF